MADTKISALPASTTPLAGTEVLPIVQSGATVKVAISDVTAGRAVSAASVAVSTGNLSFGSTGQKIVGDFSNSDQSLRTAFQTSTVNGSTRLTVIPNGTGTVAACNLYDRTDVANASVLNLNMISASEAQINSNRNGTGTYLPLSIYTNGSKQINVATTGDVSVLTGNLVIGTSGKGIDFSATPGTGTSELLNDYEEGTWTPIDSSGAGLTFVAATGSYTKVGNLVSASGFVQFPVTASVLGITIGGLPFTSANTTNRGVGALTYKQTAAAATLLLNNNATTMLVVNETGSVTTNVSLSNAVLYFGVTYSI